MHALDPGIPAYVPLGQARQVEDKLALMFGLYDPMSQPKQKVAPVKLT